MARPHRPIVGVGRGAAGPGPAQTAHVRGLNVLLGEMPRLVPAQIHPLCDGALTRISGGPS